MPPYEVKQANPSNMIALEDRLATYVHGSNADDVLKLMLKLEDVTAGRSKLWHVTADGRTRCLSASRVGRRPYAELRYQQISEALEALCAPLFNDEQRERLSRVLPHIWLRGSKPPKLGVVQRFINHDVRQYHAAINSLSGVNALEQPQGVAHVNMWVRLLQGIATGDTCLRPHRNDPPRLYRLKQQIQENCNRGRARRLLNSMEGALTLNNFS